MHIIFIKFLLNITKGGLLIFLCIFDLFMFTNMRILYLLFILCFVCSSAGKMAPQVTINFNELLFTIVVKHGMLMPRRNVQMVFTIGPQSILLEFPLSKIMEPLRGPGRSRRFVPMIDKLLTKKAIKNLKRSKHRSDKCRAKSSTPKRAPSPALELAKMTLRRASQQRPSFIAHPSMAMPHNPVPAPRCRPIPT